MIDAGLIKKCVNVSTIQFPLKAFQKINEFIKDFSPSVAYKFIDGNIGLKDEKLSLPYYMLLYDL